MNKKMDKLYMLTACAVLMAATAKPATTSIAQMTLDGDRTIETTGETSLYFLNATTSCTLTVVGGGELHVSRVISDLVKFKVEDGQLFIGGDVPPPPVLASAQMWLDAAMTNTISTEYDTATGREFVNTWTDANGSNITATAGAVAPYLTRESGRTYVDFGSVRKGDNGGYGGFMSIAKVSGFSEAFWVARPDDGLKESTVRSSVLTATSGWSVFLAGANNANYWPEVVWQWHDNRPSVYTRDGIYCDGTKQNRGGAWQEGVHSYDIQIDDAAPTDKCFFEGLCHAIEDSSFGGFRVGEVVVFGDLLSEGERDMLNAYFKAKWQIDDERINPRRVEVCEGGTASLWNGDGWDRYELGKGLVQTPVLELDGDTVIDVGEGVTNEVLMLAADSSCVLTKTGAGVLKICSTASSGVTITVNGGEVVFGEPSAPVGALWDAVLWLDASRPSTLITTATEYGEKLACWAGANAHSASAAAGDVPPSIVMRGGRNYVDFGEADTAAPYMTFQETTGIREAFVVAKGSEGIAASGCRVGVLGYPASEWNVFMPGFAGTSCQVFNQYQTYSDQIKGRLSVDGTVIGNGTNWRTDGVYVYGFNLAETGGSGDVAKASSLCSAPKGGRGGFEVGEVIVFTKRLSDEDRELITRYLMAKWKAVRRVMEVKSVSGGVIKAEAGRLEIVEFPTDDKLDIVAEGGTMAFVPLARSAIFHADAEDDASMAKSLVNGTNFVSRWSDTDGGSVYADASSGVAPYLTADGGHQYLDFGTGKNDSVDGYGASLWLSQILTGLRDVFFVVCPDESLIAGRIRACVIDHRTEWRAFQPGYSQSATDFHEMFNSYADYTKQLLGGIFVDGVAVGNRSNWQSGFHLYNFRPCDNADVLLAADKAEVNSICQTSAGLGNACGGFRIGELLLFDRRLGDDERAFVQRQLRAKWFGDTGNPCMIGSLSVAPGDSVKIPYAAVTLGTLSIGGTVEAQCVTAERIAPLAVGAMVSGVLDVRTPGTILVDSSVFGHPEGDFKVLSASGVLGRATGWKLDGDLARGRRIKVKSDGLYAVTQIGLTIRVK